MNTKLKETRDRGSDELRKEIDEKRRHLFDLRSQAVTEKLEDPSQLKKTRKEIARILTILKEREISDQKKAEPKTEPKAQPKAESKAKTKTKARTKAKAK
jgi:large subunit ribosomal protein L29